MYLNNMSWQMNIFHSIYCHISNNIDSSPPIASSMHQIIGWALVQIMACRLFGSKPLSKPNACLLSTGPFGTKFSEIFYHGPSGTKFSEIFYQNPSICQGGDELKLNPIAVYSLGKSPRKGPVMRKSCHVMTSSCIKYRARYCYWEIIR